MSTERPSPRYSDIDAWNAEDIADSMVEAQLSAVASVYTVRGEIAAAASAIHARLADKGRLIYAGAGTSGRLAAQDGAELIPTFNWPEERLLLLMAGGHDALLRSIEGAEDDVRQATTLIAQNSVSADDVLIAIAASGTTPFTLACLREAKRRGALTIGIANNKATPLLQECDYPICLETGSEPIAGSTRLKAGTAQKVTLNTLSSLAMILQGKIHRGLMVDVRALNEKLVRRSEDMLIQLTSCDRAKARDALDQSNGNVKIAALLLNGCEADAAARLLHLAGGRLGEALALANKSRASG